jgi:hypothetical protein
MRSWGSLPSLALKRTRNGLIAFHPHAAAALDRKATRTGADAVVALQAWLSARRPDLRNHARTRRLRHRARPPTVIARVRHGGATCDAATEVRQRGGRVIAGRCVELAYFALFDGSWWTDGRGTIRSWRGDGPLVVRTGRGGVARPARVAAVFAGETCRAARRTRGRHGLGALGVGIRGRRVRPTIVRTLDDSTAAGESNHDDEVSEVPHAIAYSKVGTTLRACRFPNVPRVEP